MKRIYISGPITGYDIEERKAAFAKAAEDMKREFGCEVVNPMENQPEGWTWDEYMKRDIMALLECDAIAMMPGWKRSKGAVLERAIAESLSGQFGRVIMLAPKGRTCGECMHCMEDEDGWYCMREYSQVGGGDVACESFAEEGGDE